MYNLLSGGFWATFSSVLLALAILLGMITVHEFGHYIVGKIFKFKINEFSIGMGPAIYKHTNKDSGELFAIRLLPLGGYCAFEGEDEDGNENPNAFNNKKPWQRILVLLAGVTMNFILAIVVICISIGGFGQISIQTYDIRNQPEFEYSLQNDDVIMEIDGKSIFMATDVIDALKGKKKGEVVDVKVLRGEKSEAENVKVTLRNDVSPKNLTDVICGFTSLGISTIVRVDEVGETAVEGVNKGVYLLRLKDEEEYDDCTRIFELGDLIRFIKSKGEGDTVSFYVVDYDKSSEGEKIIVSVKLNRDYKGASDDDVLNAVGIKAYSTLLKYADVNVKFNFFESVGRSFKYAFKISGTIFTTLGQLLTGHLGLNAMGGTFTTISATTTVIRDGGAHYFFEIAGYIGVNLAVFNLLPLPALDGSRIVFCIIEWIRKKPVNRKIEGVIHGVGLVLLLGFSLLVDILQLF